MIARWPLVLLAGGASSRMGQPKGLLAFRGRCWLEAQLEVFASAGGREALAVIADLEAHRCALPWIDDALERGTQFLLGGHGPPGSRSALAHPPVLGARLRERQLFGMRVCAVHQPRPEEGPFSSLRLGLATSEAFRPPEETAAGAFVLPVDVPVCESTLHALASAIGSHDAAVPRFQGRGGHPVLLSAAFARRVQETPLDAPDARLDRQLAASSRADVSLHEPTVTMNLNTLEAWSAWASSADAARCYPIGGSRASRDGA